MAEKARPIYIIKKKGGHGGHHGGAWKVAYADFVTAMMSLFIVLWLMSSSSKVKEAVSGYFNDPKGTGKLLGTQMSGKGEGPAPAPQSSTEALEKLKEKIEAEIKLRKDLQKLSKQIEITVTPEGLRIELIESKNGTFYELGSPKLSHDGEELMGLLAGQLKTLPNVLLLEGYTDSAQYTASADYSNWELSADRANAARRLLQGNGVRPTQVREVRGYADQKLRVKNNPSDPSNRRVSILVKNDTETVPIVSAQQVVSGKTPLPGSAADKKKNETESKSGPDSKENAGGKNDGEAKPVRESKPAPEPKPAEAPSGKEEKSDAKRTSEAKTAATTPAAKPGLIDRLKAMLPGHKSAPSPSLEKTAAAPVAEKSASVEPKPTASATPGMLDRLKAMLPGRKK